MLPICSNQAPTSPYEITLTQVSSDVMSVIIDYAYTRHAKVTVSNVEQLLPAADQFHVLGLVKVSYRLTLTISYICCYFIVICVCV